VTEARRIFSTNLDASADDFDHPQYDELVALVEGRLDEIDREVITSHLESCVTCREDVDDLVQIQASLPTTAGESRAWLKQVAGFAAVAAALGVVLWFGLRPTGGRLTVPQASAPPAVATAPATPPPAPTLTLDEQQHMARALETGTLEWPTVMTLLRGHTGTLLGTTAAPAVFVPTAPRGTAVLETRPTFSWTAMPDATAYSVAVFDERFNEVANSGTLAMAPGTVITTWTPSRDLPRGRMLAWQVTATTPSGAVTSPAPPRPEARFIVLDSAAVSSLTNARVRLSREPVALALTLTKTGLFADAERALEQALADPRYDAAQVRALLARLRAR